MTSKRILMMEKAAAKRKQIKAKAPFCLFFIAGVLFFMGLNTLNPLNFNSMLNLRGLLPVGIGLALIGSQVVALANKSRLRRTVKYEFESNLNASGDTISESTGIPRQDVQAIILDLKMRGELRGDFSFKTGELKGIPVESPTAEKPAAKFCPSCGSTIKKGEAAYCVVCGMWFGVNRSRVK